MRGEERLFVGGGESAPHGAAIHAAFDDGAGACGCLRAGLPARVCQRSGATVGGGRTNTAKGM